MLNYDCSIFSLRETGIWKLSLVWIKSLCSPKSFQQPATHNRACHKHASNVICLQRTSSRCYLLCFWIVFLFVYLRKRHSDKGKQEVHGFCSPNNNEWIIVNEFPWNHCRENIQLHETREGIVTQSPLLKSQGSNLVFPILTGYYSNPPWMICTLNLSHLFNKSEMYTKCLLCTQMGTFSSSTLWRRPLGDAVLTHNDRSERVPPGCVPKGPD